ncbi:LysR family transcriptional regulator [Kineosporia mesophila]|uniref:LysR family transcriptional regulator n=1 Tax=Kineosporia mesophila TaxID=566012 RepID=A0ABP6Z6K8_9ACTN|nr:LysR family transcriptional regulator [Kineosporia mesophila]MCD5352923.1 LysR family transcriptional regulator [Kineosporia mesophila]
MNDLETRQLKYFVAVAEEKNFSRAAVRLGIAQPPLSRAIRDLERQLGSQLLVRTTRQVTLTPAGEMLLTEGRRLIGEVEALARRVHDAGRLARPLRLALKADYDGGLLPRIVDAFHTVPLELLLGGRGEQVTALNSHQADVALLPTPYDETGLEREDLLTGARLIGLSAADPLAARTSLRLSDLAGRTLPDGTAAELGGLEMPPGYRQTRDLAQIFSLVEVGRIVWFVPEWIAARFPRPHIAYRPVEDLEPVTLTVAWRAGSRSPEVAAFVRTVQEVAETALLDGLPGARPPAATALEDLPERAEQLP